MSAAVIAILVFGFTFTVLVIGFMMFADKWLRRVDKDKYLDKSLKKQLKKGNISLWDYESAKGMIRK